MTVTLRDVARVSGYSVTTVSRALNGFPDVNHQTREHILRVARDLNYVPNLSARQLQTRRSRTLAFVIPLTGERFADPFVTEILSGIGQAAGAAGYDLLVSTRPPGSAEQEAYRLLVRGRRIDGCILMRVRRRDARVAYLLEERFPFVVFGRTEGNQEYPYVDVDGQAGIAMATRHLIDLGHRRIAYLSAPLVYTFAQFRLAGYYDALREAGIDRDDSLVAYAEHLTEESGYRAASALLGAPGRALPTAIVACTDLVAMGALSAARAFRLQVGRDLSITGFDDLPIAAHTSPPLTTIRQPIAEIGRRLVEMLIALIEERPLEERQVVLAPQLIVRESTTSPP